MSLFGDIRSGWSILGLALVMAAAPSRACAEELYASSVVGTDFDFILGSDPDTFLCLEFKGQGPREMPDKTGDTSLFQQAFIFVSYFSDGTSVDMAMDIDFETKERARKEALRYTPRLGKLPTSLRRGVKRLVVHKGNQNATAFSDVGLIVIYSDNATRRIETHDLEETIFHESVHASWDKTHANSAAWRAAQKSDGTFVTRYARKKPDGEDLAESALFAYTLVHHPGRIPTAEAVKIKNAIPARIAFVEKLVPPGKPIHYQVAPRYACDGSGKTFTVTVPQHALAGYRKTMDGDNASPCTVDLTRVGTLADIISNALMHGLGQKEADVRRFLERAQRESKTPDELIRKTVAKFELERAELEVQIQKFFHCNCGHDKLPDPPLETVTSLRADHAKPAESEGPSEKDNMGPWTTSPILYVIAGLLLALLVVNLMSLVVQMRRVSGPSA